MRAQVQPRRPLDRSCAYKASSERPKLLAAGLCNRIRQWQDTCCCMWHSLVRWCEKSGRRRSMRSCVNLAKAQRYDARHRSRRAE